MTLGDQASYLPALRFDKHSLGQTKNRKQAHKQGQINTNIKQTDIEKVNDADKCTDKQTNKQ